jgi:hypothetical protein
MLLHDDYITKNTKVKNTSMGNLFYTLYNSQNLNFELQPHEEALSERGNYTEYYPVPSAACAMSKILYFSQCNYTPHTGLHEWPSRDHQHPGFLNFSAPHNSYCPGQKRSIPFAFPWFWLTSLLATHL